MNFDLHDQKVSIRGQEIDAFLEMFYYSDRKSKKATDKPIWRASRYPEDDVRTLSGAAFHGIIHVMTETSRHRLEGVSDSTDKIARSGLRNLLSELRAAERIEAPQSTATENPLPQPKLLTVLGRLGRRVRGESA